MFMSKLLKKNSILRNVILTFFLLVGCFTFIALSGPNSFINSPDGKYIAKLLTSGKDVHYQVIEKKTGRLILTTHAEYRTPNDVKAGEFSPDSKIFAAAYHYGHAGNYTWIGIWDIETGNFLYSEKKQQWTRDISWVFQKTPSNISPNKKYKAIRVGTTSNNHYIIIEIGTNRKLFSTFAQYSSPNDVKAFEFSPDSKKFAAAYHYGHAGNYTWIGIWDIATGKLINSVKKPDFIIDIPNNVFQ